MLDLVVQDSFKTDALCCCLSALDYFNFSGFSTNGVYAENWFVCVLLSATGKVAKGMENSKGSFSGEHHWMQMGFHKQAG